MAASDDSLSIVGSGRASTQPAGTRPRPTSTPHTAMRYSPPGSEASSVVTTCGQHEAELRGQLAAELTDPGQQVAAGDQVGDVEGDAELERLGAHLGDERLGIVRVGGDRDVGDPPSGVSAPRGLHAAGEEPQPDGEAEERDLGHARDERHDHRAAGGDAQGERVPGQLAGELLAEVGTSPRPG